MLDLLRKPLFSLLSGLLLISIFSVPVFSKELPKQEPDKTTKTEQQSETYDRGTTDLPVIIQIAPSAPLKIETDRDKEAERKKSVNEEWTANGTAAIAVFTFALAFATIGLAVFTYNLWGETGKLVRDAKDTAERQLRAYVTIDLHIREYPVEKPHCYDILLIVTNTGKTWARHLTIQKEVIDETKIGQRDPFDCMTNPIGPPMVLGPGQTHPLQFDVVEFSDVLNIAKMDIRKVFVAVVRYRDAFSSEARQMQLSRRVNGDKWGKISFSWMPTHNCADEDCP